VLKEEGATPLSSGGQEKNGTAPLQDIEAEDEAKNKKKKETHVRKKRAGEKKEVSARKRKGLAKRKLVLPASTEKLNVVTEGKEPGCAFGRRGITTYFEGWDL